MAKIILRGKLGKIFGKEWELNVLTAKEALAAINANTGRKFLDYMHDSVKYKNIGYKIIVDDFEIKDNTDTQILNKKLNKESIINIIPIIGGSLVVTTVVLMVISIALQIVSMALASNPTVNSSNDVDEARADSYLFSGRGSTARQGKPVPVGYGRMMISPMTISLKYNYKLIKTS